jgi:aldehyde:ferredoxin oxidoreductase
MVAISPAREKLVQIRLHHERYLQGDGQAGNGVALGSKNFNALVVKGSGPISIDESKELYPGRTEPRDRLKRALYVPDAL